MITFWLVLLTFSAPGEKAYAPEVVSGYHTAVECMNDAGKANKKTELKGLEPREQNQLYVCLTVVYPT
jgi:hypothetical protein